MFRKGISHISALRNVFLQTNFTLFFFSRVSTVRMTALVVKVLSMIAERQVAVVGQQGRASRFVPLSEIRHSVGYLLSVQESDGSFGDANPVLHRDVLVITTVYI